MRKNQKLLSWAVCGLMAMTALSCSNKEDYEGLDHNYGTTQYAKVTYQIALHDPHVLEAADVLLSYKTIDGSTHEDTLRTASWQQTIRVPWSKDYMNEDKRQVPFGLALHYLSKSQPRLTYDTYDFGVTLAAPMYTYDEKGDSLPWGGKLTLHTSGLLNSKTPVLTRDSLLTADGSILVDTTGVYYNQVASDRYSVWKDNGPYAWDYGQTAYTCVNYTLKVSDANVFDVARLLLTYPAADGTQHTDTLRSLDNGVLTIPVRYRYQADGTSCRFEARFVLRDTPLVDYPDGTGMNFHIDITSPYWFLDRKWQRGTSGNLAADRKGGLMIQSTQTVLSDTLKTPEGRQLVNATFLSWDSTVSDRSSH